MASNDWITVAKITTVFGIKGWLKIHSYTEPAESLFSYSQMHLWHAMREQRQALQFDAYRAHGKGYIAHIQGCDDRNSAEHYVQQEIQVPSSSLEALETGEFYWHELEGLVVWNRDSQRHTPRVCLGVVSHLLATGANDVLVVEPTEHSIDQKQRLIPYIDQVVKKVDLAQQLIELDWDADF